MNFPELLQWVKFGQKTGTLVFEKKGVVKKIFVEKGLIVSASSNDPKEYLGQILICFGLINEVKLKEAFSHQKESGKLLGKILCEDFGLQEPQILSALRVKIEETIYDLFLWDDGKFVFTEGIPQFAEHDRLSTAITIDQVMFEGARRLDEWKEFKKQYPTDDVVFRAKPNAELGDLSKNFIVMKIFRALDGEKSMRRILLETHAPEYRGTEAFAKLVWGGFVEAVKKSAPIRAELGQAEESLLKNAMERFKAKNFAVAYSLIEEFLFAEPDHEEGQTLYRVVRDGYLEQLRELFPPDAVPSLAVELSHLNEKIFSPKEGFIASRINGQWDVKSIVMVSPLGEFESLRVFKRLVDEGIVKLKSKKG